MISDFTLIIIRKDRTQTIKLHLQKYLIGRQQSCEVCLNETFVSRQHCTLVLEKIGSDYQYVLWDGIPLGSPSRHGTFINGERISKAILKSGDIVTFSINKEYPHLLFADKNEKQSDATLGVDDEEASKSTLL